MDDVNFDYYIYPPNNLTDMTASNLTLVVEMMLDTKETVGGTENVHLYPPSDEYTTEKFRYSGYSKIIRRYPVINEYDRNNKLFVKFHRDTEREIVELWSQKRITGFSVRWYFEDGNGR